MKRIKLFLKQWGMAILTVLIGFALTYFLWVYALVLMLGGLLGLIVASVCVANREAVLLEKKERYKKLFYEFRNLYNEEKKFNDKLKSELDSITSALTNQKQQIENLENNLKEQVDVFFNLLDPEGKC